MNIRSAKFIKGVVKPDEIFENGKPQVAFIGRSNVGKSSLINTLTKQKGLARTSSSPGRTREINVFLINKSYYFVDLPGYGYAKTSAEGREQLRKLIDWYLFDSGYDQYKIVLIIDANVGPTDQDLVMLQNLEAEYKDVLIVANKIDKIKKSQIRLQLQKIQSTMGGHAVIPFSSEKGIGISELLHEILYTPPL